MKTLAQLKELLREAKPVLPFFPGSLSSGSTLLNMACSGKPDGCFLKGHYYLFVGDSNSGKTWLCFTCLAEAARNPDFDGYRFVYDNVEDGALFDWARFFGLKVAERVEPPAKDKQGAPIYSSTVEEFYYNLDDCVKKGPCIYILDSMDALTTDAELKKFFQKKKAHEKDETTSGSYGTSKASRNSEGVRIANNLLKKNGSILIIVSQTRDKIGFGSQYDPKTRAGGHAMKFYATLEIWSSVREKLTQTVAGKSRQQGILSKVQVKRSRLTGKDRAVFVPIYWSAGIDETGSMVDWLVDEGVWSVDKGIIKATDFDAKGGREKIVRLIEERNLEQRLRKIVVNEWNEIEERTAVKRKPRYT